MGLSKEELNRDNSLLIEIVQKSGEKIQNCYQCQKCSAGCPVNFAMDILPNQMFRHIQYGHREKVLSSKTIWICAYCHACSVRCPNGIDIARVMDTLRHISYSSGEIAGEKNVTIFHTLFLKLIRTTGRMHELGLLAFLKLKTGNLFKDAALGYQLFRKGKIRLVPKFGGGKEFRAIFSTSEKRIKR
jgi:heterodisulfide reductase subunit C